MSRFKRYLAAVFAVGLMALVAACGGSDGGDSTDSAAASNDVAWAGNAKNAEAIEQLYEKAKAAGDDQVAIYGPYAELYMPLWKHFEKRFPGIKIVAKTIPGAGTVATLQSEVSSGRGVGDMVIQGLEGVAVPATEGLLEEFVPPNIDGVPAELQDKKGRFVVQFGDIFGFLYNTNEMSEEDLPGTLDELVSDPALKGFVVDDPALGAVTAFSLMPIFVEDKLNLETMEKLKANATIVDSLTPSYAELNTGQVKMMPWASHMRYLNAEEAGAAVGYKAVPGLSSLVLGGTGIIKSAPHPDAAKLFQSWFITPEAQNALVEEGKSVALLKGVEYPSEWPDYNELYEAVPKILPLDFPKVKAEFQEFIKPVFN